MRKYTYILQTHNPDKKYIVDNIVENISFVVIVNNIARKSTLSTMLRLRARLAGSRSNTTKRVDDNCFTRWSIGWPAAARPTGQTIATDRNADVSIHIHMCTCSHVHMFTCSHVHIHMLNSCQSLKHRTGIENSRLAIIRPQLFGVKCTKIHEDAPAKITLTRAHPQMCTKSRAFVWPDHFVGSIYVATLGASIFDSSSSWRQPFKNSSSVKLPSLFSSILKEKCCHI